VILLLKNENQKGGKTVKMMMMMMMNKVEYIPTHEPLIGQMGVNKGQKI
jgi:hypothetical protein